MQCIHHSSGYLTEYPHSLQHPTNEEINQTDLSREKEITAGQFRILLKEHRVIDAYGRILSSDLMNIVLPELNDDHKNKLKNLLEKSFTITGRIPAHPLNLQISIFDIIAPFFLNHDVFLTGGTVWKLLGDEYFENYFKMISNSIHQFPQLSTHLSNLLKEKTSRDGDIDLVILIKDISELQKFYDVLNRAHTKLYSYPQLYDYLENKQIYLKEKNDPLNYSFQVLANADLQTMSFDQMKQMVLELNCFEMAKNVKENGFEFYIRSLTATDGTKYDFTFVVSSSFYAYTLQGLNLPLRAYNKSSTLRPQSFHPNPHQVIFDVNTGTIRLKNKPSFSDRELALFYTILTRGNLHIEKDTEKIVTNYVKASFQQDCFIKKILDLIAHSSKHHLNNSISSALCLSFNICSHLQKILPDCANTLKTLHQGFTDRFKSAINTGDFFTKLFNLSKNFSVTECFLKIWALVQLSSNQPLEGYDILFADTGSPQTLQIRVAFKENPIKGYVNLNFDVFNIETLNTFSDEEFEPFLDFLAFDLEPDFKFQRILNKPLESILSGILSTKELVKKSFVTELEIYFLMISLTSSASPNHLYQLLSKLFDDSLLSLPLKRRKHVIDLILKFLETVVSSKTLDCTGVLLQEYCHPSSQLIDAKVKLWTYLPEFLPSIQQPTNYWLIYSIFAHSIPLSDKFLCFELANKHFSSKICHELLFNLIEENDPELMTLRWQFSLQILIKNPNDSLALTHLKDCSGAFKTSGQSFEIDKIKLLYLQYLEKISLEFFEKELIDITIDLLSCKILSKEDLKKEFRAAIANQLSKNFFEPLCQVKDLLLLIQRLEKFFDRPNHQAYKAHKKEALLHFFYLCHLHPEKLVKAYQPKVEYIIGSILKTFDSSEITHFQVDLAKLLSDHLFFKASHPLFYVEGVIKLFYHHLNILPDTTQKLLTRYIDYYSETKILVDWKLIEPITTIENVLDSKDLINLYYLLIVYEKKNLISFVKFHEMMVFHIKECAKPSFFSTLLEYYEMNIPSQEEPLRSAGMLALGNYYNEINNYDRAIDFYKVYCLAEPSELVIRSLIGKVFEMIEKRSDLAQNLALCLHPHLKGSDQVHIQNQLTDLLHENKLKKFVELSIAHKKTLCDQEYLAKIEDFLLDPKNNFQQNFTYLRIILQYFENFSFLSLKNLNRFIYQLYSQSLSFGGLEHLLYRNSLLINDNSKTGNSCLHHLFLHTAKTNSLINWKKILLHDEFAVFKVFSESKNFSNSLCHIMFDSWLETLAADPKKGCEIGGCIDLIPPVLLENIYWQPSLYSKLAKIYLFSPDPKYFFKGAKILDDVDNLANLSYEEILYFGNSFKPYIAGFHKLNIPIDQTHFKLIVNTTLLAFAVQDIAPRDWLNFMIVLAKFIEKSPENTSNLQDYCKKFCQFITSKARDTKLTKHDLKAFRTIIDYSSDKGYFCKACLKLETQDRWLGGYHTKHSQSCLEQKEIYKLSRPDYLSDRLINGSMNLLKNLRPYSRKIFSTQFIFYMNHIITFLLAFALMYLCFKINKPPKAKERD